MKNKSGLTQFFRQSAIYGLGGIINKSLSFLLLPLYTSFLTLEDYGVIGIISVTISLLIPLSVFGISSSLVMEFYHAETEEKRKNIVSVSIFLSCVLSLIVTSLLFLSSEWISMLLFSSRNMSYPIKLASITLFLDGVSSVGFSYLRCRQFAGRFVSMSVISMVIAALFNVLFIAFLQRGVVGFYEATILSGVIQVAVLIFWITRYTRRLSIDKNIFVSLIKLGLPAIPVRLAGWVLMSANRYFLLVLASLAETGIFNMAFRFAAILELMFISVYRYAAEPYILSRMKEKDASVVYRRVVSYMVMYGVFLTVLLASTAKEIIILMARNSAFWRADRSVGLLTLAFLFYGFYSLYYPILGIIKKPGLAVPVLIAAAIINGILNFLFVPIWGAAGSAFGLAISFICATVLMDLVTRRYYQISFAWATIIRTLIAGVLCFGCVFFLPSWKPIWSLIIKIAVIVLGYPLLLFVLGAIDEVERKYILSRIEKKRVIGKMASFLIGINLSKVFIH